jgi:cell division protease FtsH
VNGQGLPNNNNQQGGNLGQGRRWLLYVLILLGVSLLPLLFSVGFGSGSSRAISYSDFRAQLEQGNVRSIQVTGNSISGQFKGAPSLHGQAATSNFTTYLPSFGDPGLLPLLESQGVQVIAKPQSTFSWLTLLIDGLPFLLMLWFFSAFYRTMRSQGQSLFSLGKSGARLYERSRESTTFGDVAGIEGVKGEMKEIVDYLTHPERFARTGAKSPRGVLLVGPPGSGKTLLARAVAGEANAHFYSITGSDFMEMFVGVGASRVRDLFREAKRTPPSIIFIDELDSIGRHRGAGLGGGHDEREQTLNQLLSEMDGFEAHTGTIVLAATNRPDILDPALLRPGRFDRRIVVDLPTMGDRVEILKIHARGKPMSPEVDFGKLARATPGFSGADLENLLNEAALSAARRNRGRIGQEEIDDAYDKVVLGLERTNLALTPEEKKVLAYHESGHALVAMRLPHADPVRKVTIIPHAGSMGVTQQLPERDRYIYEKDYLLDRIAVMMGGRAAEELKNGSMTSGAESDLKEATRLARRMVLDWGMGDRHRNQAMGTHQRHVFLGEEIGSPREYSEETARQIDAEVSDILSACYERAAGVLRENSEVLDSLTSVLVEKEVLDGSEVIRIVNGLTEAADRAS